MHIQSSSPPSYSESLLAQLINEDARRPLEDLISFEQSQESDDQAKSNKHTTNNSSEGLTPLSEICCVDGVNSSVTPHLPRESLIRNSEAVWVQTQNKQDQGQHQKKLICSEQLPDEDGQANINPLTTKRSSVNLMLSPDKRYTDGVNGLVIHQTPQENLIRNAEAVWRQIQNKQDQEQHRKKLKCSEQLPEEDGQANTSQLTTNSSSVYLTPSSETQYTESVKDSAKHQVLMQNSNEYNSSLLDDEYGIAYCKLTSPEDIDARMMYLFTVIYLRPEFQTDKHHKAYNWKKISAFFKDTFNYVLPSSNGYGNLLDRACAIREDIESCSDFITQSVEYYRSIQTSPNWCKIAENVKQIMRYKNSNYNHKIHSGFIEIWYYHQTTRLQKENALDAIAKTQTTVVTQEGSNLSEVITLDQDFEASKEVTPYSFVFPQESKADYGIDRCVLSDETDVQGRNAYLLVTVAPVLQKISSNRNNFSLLRTFFEVNFSIQLPQNVNILTLWLKNGKRLKDLIDRHRATFYVEIDKYKSAGKDPAWHEIAKVLIRKHKSENPKSKLSLPGGFLEIYYHHHEVELQNRNQKAESQAQPIDQIVNSAQESSESQPGTIQPIITLSNSGEFLINGKPIANTYYEGEIALSQLVESEDSTLLPENSHTIDFATQ